MPKPSNLEDWLSRWDMQAVPDFDDKLRECEFFFGLLEKETDRCQFRWLLSGLLNAAYSFLSRPLLLHTFDSRTQMASHMPTATAWKSFFAT